MMNLLRKLMDNCVTWVGWVLLTFIIAGCTLTPEEPILSSPSPLIQNATATASPNSTSPESISATATSGEVSADSLRPSATISPAVDSTSTSATEAPPATSTRAPLAPEAWKSLPVIPTVSQRAIEIYQRGQQMGRDPHAFSRVGDCQNVSSYFLSVFSHPNYYNLGPYGNLQETIDWFRDSFSRESLAVKGGFNAAAVLSPLRADPGLCQKGESPLACELRIHNPSIAIISMETWWNRDPEKFDYYMRQLIEFTIEQGVVPILATKADNLEGENKINRIVSQLALDYDIPLWNFWAAVQALPNGGLRADGFHLTLGDYFYNNPAGTQTGWSMRNLTALQALDSVWRGLSDRPNPTTP